jgi:hypothetical protein
LASYDNSSPLVNKAFKLGLLLLADSQNIKIAELLGEWE